jgi:2-methylcitrate dehydratase PrpD
MEAPPATSRITADSRASPLHRVAFLDWLACAVGGSREPAALAAAAAGNGLLERVTWAGCAGHVLDYDDTYAPGLVHPSAAVAPVALFLGAELGRDLAAVLDAYAVGFETTAALARAGHPALYENGWHPTAVCGSVGAAVGASRLHGLSPEQTEGAVALALLRAGGLRSAFGSDGKALQVGLAASVGLQAARLAQAGARVPLADVWSGPAGFERVFGGAWPQAGDEPAVRENWIKAYPCCLATHSTIEAALELRGRGQPYEGATVHVHPMARAAAARDGVSDGLQAKFSIPYLAAFALLRGAPTVPDFRSVDARVRDLAGRIAVRTDPALSEMEARVAIEGGPAAQVESPLGSPGRPMDERALRRKVRELAGDRLDGVLDDPSTPAANVLAAAGF